MFTAAAFIPGPPLLVPELANAAAAESADLRRAVLDVAGELGLRSERWVVIGVDERPGQVPVHTGADAIGTFRGFGVDVRVTLAPPAVSASNPKLPAPDRNMPLPALIAGWVRGAAAPECRCEVEYVPADASAEVAAAIGRRLRTQLDAAGERVGVLIVADGASALTERAPKAYDERAADFEDALAQALDTGDVKWLAALDERLCTALGACTRAAWQVLGALFHDGVAAVERRFDCAPYGVGYHTGVWLP
ncbi:hypothetical protein ONR57_10965 [Hoyosella sp. YIM 151337]|uniref:hypothetical protein n=1 Tax=Hoyosella sp. YIM 151337 TaxID=2992742 RepID=UPI002236BD87|nr:hypothetical protein [Hoyosella sp. YIM 151337]MCW4353818.1 hypothetical protein [Hoyosella sp. YIM 151337]